MLSALRSDTWKDRQRRAQGSSQIRWLEHGTHIRLFKTFVRCGMEKRRGVTGFWSHRLFETTIGDRRKRVRPTNMHVAGTGRAARSLGISSALNLYNRS